MHFHQQEYNSEQARLMLDRVKAMQGNAHLSPSRTLREILNEGRMETVMRNNYEASELFEFGYAHDVVMGSKEGTEIDAVLGFPFRIEPDSTDIDESDE
jgi:hypothetical protein